MTKGEREDLQRLVRQREKVLKSTARQRSTELLADFENHLGSKFSFDQDKIWAEAVRDAEKEFARANARIAERSAALGIPKEFAPQLHQFWTERGENAVKEQRAELRRMAEARIDAIEQAAIVAIEYRSIEAQTEIAAGGLTSETARAFLDRLPSVDSFMPELSFEDIAGKAEPPVAEQLVSPSALRQRRYRERHRNAQVTQRDDDKDNGE
jgi:hypothetical protein